MNMPVKTGGTERDNLEIAASRGNKRAIAALKGPPKPPYLRFLYKLHKSLQKGLGEGMNGQGVLDWPKYDAWARNMKVDYLRPEEIDALFDFDKVARQPTIMEKSDDD